REGESLPYVGEFADDSQIRLVVDAECLAGPRAQCAPDEQSEVLRVPSPGRPQVTCRLELREGVVPDRLEHRVAELVPRGVAPHEALLYERRQRAGASTRRHSFDRL